MGHGITLIDRVGIVGSRGWHGLGTPIPEGMTARQGFEHLGINFPMELAPIYAEVQRGVDANGNPIIRRINLPNNLAHIRMDNDDPMGIVTREYQQVTCLDLADMLDSLTGQDMASRLESGGTLFGGRRVFGCIRLPNVIRVGNDEVDNYVIGSNGNGGHAGLNFYHSSLRPECANMLRASEKDLGKGISYRHSGDMAEKIKQARIALGLAVKEAEKFGEQVRALAGCQLSVGQMRDFMETAYDNTYGALPDPTEQPDAFQKLLAKRTAMLARWMELVDHPTNQTVGIQGSAWQAYNAVSYWHQHERSPRLGKDQRLHSNVWGQANRDKQVAFRAALAVV